MMAPRLTDAEQANVMAALRFLRTRTGTWKLLAVGLGVEPCTIRNIKKGLKGISVNIAYRVSRLAQVPFDDVTSGKYPVAGTCPHCGRGPQ
jgi:hypothetical protein